jgi:hypothetical protein
MSDGYFCEQSQSFLVEIFLKLVRIFEPKEAFLQVLHHCSNQEIWGRQDPKLVWVSRKRQWYVVPRIHRFRLLLAEKGKMISAKCWRENSHTSRDTISSTTFRSLYHMVTLHIAPYEVSIQIVCDCSIESSTSLISPA